MSRIKITDKMIKYLEDRLNCKNVIKFIDENTNIHPNKLVVDKTPVSYKIDKFGDNDDGDNDDGDNGDNDNNGDNNNNDNNNGDKILPKSIKKNMFERFDFITEANHTGFEYFPYLYGVLTCHAGTIDTVYTFYELFDDDLTKLFVQITQPSDWYDITFQLVMINYYISTVQRYEYRNATPQNHLYKKLPSPYYKDYELDKHKFKISHKYLVVLWDFDILEQTTNTTDTNTTDTNTTDTVTTDTNTTDTNNISSSKSNIEYLLEYLETANLEVPLSGRLVKLLNRIKDHPENTIQLLDSVYNATK